MGTGGKKYSKPFKVLERQNLQNQTKSELYIDDNKSKYSSNPKELFRYTKFIKHFPPWRQLPKLLLLNFLAKFLTETKYLMKNLR